MLESQKTEIMMKTQKVSTDLDFEGDDVDEIQAKILALTTSKLLARDKDKLFRIDMALKKIAEGKFGTCEQCNEEIFEKRLLANPMFNTCISCAEELEMLKKKIAH